METKMIPGLFGNYKLALFADFDHPGMFSMIDIHSFSLHKYD